MMTQTIITSRRARLQKLALTSSMTAFMLTGVLQMGAAQAADGAAKEKESLLGLEEIVVTGTPGGDGVRKLDASFAVSTLNSADIKKFAPKSTADLFKAVPGVSVESSGGESGANVFVRGFPSGGDAVFTTVALEGLPIFTPSTLSFLENSTLFRLDETIERVEALRGGPNPIFSNGQPGVTFNFRLKQGGPEQENLIKLTGSDYGERRVDAFFSGELSKDLFYAVGGFYRVSDGIRDTQFTSEEGGQISANITKLLEKGTLNVYARYVNDNNQWILPIPLQSNADGEVSEFPGFDAGTGTYLSNDLRLGVLELGNGVFSRRDAADGRGPNIVTLGSNLDLELNDRWSLSEKVNYTTGEANTIGFVPAGGVTTAGEFLEARGGAGATGNFSFVSSGAALTDLSTPVLELGFWAVDKDITSFSNDFSLAYKATEKNKITAGVFYSHFSSKDVWSLGNAQLVTASQNAQRIDLTLDDGRIATRDGFSGAPFFAVNADYDGDTVAGYLADEWQITPALRLDAGIRVENYKVDATLENVDFGVDLDNDPNTLYNNSAAVLNGSFRSIEFDETEFSWTIGLNYNLSETASVFARINQGSRFPQFDDLRDGQAQIQDVDQYELGLKLSQDNFAAFATFFYNEFTGLTFQRFINGQNVTEIGDSRAYGLELEALYEPVENLSFTFSGTYQDAEFNNFGANSGNQINRQPEFQFRLTPSYALELPFGRATLYGTVSYIDDRFSDPENQQVLPSYTKYDAGVIVDIDDRFQIQIVGDNLTDKIGLTEGNPRILGAQSGTILARPILGRSFRFSLAYNF